MTLKARDIKQEITLSGVPKGLMSDFKCDLGTFESITPDAYPTP